MFTINGETWLIKFTQPYDEMLLMSSGKYSLGVCDDTLKTIFISNELKDKKLKLVLCHEIVHAAMFSYNVILSYEQEELIANIIATYGKEIIQIAEDMFKRLSIK